MKTTMHLMAIASILFLSFTACDEERVVGESALPKEASLYIGQHFPLHEVAQVVKERDDLKTTYDVFLSEGYRLEFSKKGNILGVEGNSKLPDSVIPAAILVYVQANYPDEHILDWELDDIGQEVKLSNRIELKFDKNGNFLRID